MGVFSRAIYKCMTANGLWVRSNSEGMFLPCQRAEVPSYEAWSRETLLGFAKRTPSALTFCWVRGSKVFHRQHPLIVGLRYNKNMILGRVDHPIWPRGQRMSGERLYPMSGLSSAGHSVWAPREDYAFSPSSTLSQPATLLAPFPLPSLPQCSNLLSTT